MSGGKIVDHQKLLEWTANFKNNKTLSFSTNSAAVNVAELEKFIVEAKKKYPGDFNGLRIYLIRYSLPEEMIESAKSKIGSSGNNLSQPSIVFVPLRLFDASTGSGEDYKIGTTNDIYVLAFSEPDNSDPEDTTVLCPPKCN